MDGGSACPCLTEKCSSNFRVLAIIDPFSTMPHLRLNPLNAELNPICHLLALLGAHHILHVSRIRVKHTKWQHTFKTFNGSFWKRIYYSDDAESWFLRNIGGFLKGYTASNFKTVFFKFTAVSSTNLYLQQSFQKSFRKRNPRMTSEVAPVT